MHRVSVGFRLSERAVRLLARIAEDQGISKTGALERAIRELAKRLGVTEHDGAPGAAP